MQLVADLQFGVQLARITGLGLCGSAYTRVTSTALTRAAHGARGGTGRRTCRTTG